MDGSWQSPAKLKIVSSLAATFNLLVPPGTLQPLAWHVSAKKSWILEIKMPNT